MEVVGHLRSAGRIWKSHSEKGDRVVVGKSPQPCLVVERARGPSAGSTDLF